MKHVQQNLKRRAGIVGMMCLLTGLLTSCLKNHDNDYVEPPVALLSVINASPDSQSVSFFLDQNRANNAPIRYGHGLDYIAAYPGKRTASFYVAGSGQKIISDTITLTAKKYYSIYLSNLASKPDIILLTDSITRPDAGKATIRLVNVSPDAGAVDLAVKGGNVLASNKTYKGASPFVPIESASSYTLEIRKKGTSTVLVTLSDIRLNSNSVYTVWLHGLSSATGLKKLSADIQTNAFYY
ncbi:DUF4397 domain-containing protein [Mucilaginibacter pocheonensis]|uniref:DUF4397 domain-containing protein n=1 Tax=Mucilaginibacter pocheonensis TaxID=398050 RepID=A0ABU1T6D2_9SPHI|nr:DUF4397 domain-containing protein [Mucilaginibacter pocheonensis]MDR6940796.1 hypothetical protein [Mucilaginibacter pocheonensis]